MDAHQRQAALDRARGGDGSALGDLLQSFRPYVRGVVRTVLDERLRSRLDDSDLIQDALLEAHRGGRSSVQRTTTTQIARIAAAGV